jgi:hypothetical protein
LNWVDGLVRVGGLGWEVWVCGLGWIDGWV